MNLVSASISVTPANALFYECVLQCNNLMVHFYVFSRLNWGVVSGKIIQREELSEN